MDLFKAVECMCVCVGGGMILYIKAYNHCLVEKQEITEKLLTKNGYHRLLFLCSTTVPSSVSALPMFEVLLLR